MFTFHAYLMFTIYAYLKKTFFFKIVTIIKSILLIKFLSYILSYLIDLGMCLKNLLIQVYWGK